MSVNNFKELEKQIISSRGSGGETTKESINSNNNIFHFIGDLIELYLGRLISGLIGWDQDRASKNRKFGKK